MSLKAVVSADEFGELDATVQQFYSESEDGGYVLAIDGVDNHPTVKGLKSGHQRSKQERDEAKRRAEDLKRRFGPLAEIEGLDLSDADQERLEKALPFLKGEADSLGDGGEQEQDRGAKPNGKGQPDIEKIKANARKPIERERDEAAARAEAAESKLAAVVSDAALTSAVAEVKVAGPYTKAVKAMFRDKVKITEDDDGNPVAVIDGEYGEQPVDKYLKEWSQTDEGKAFIEAPMNGGGGSRGGGAGSGVIKNPFKKSLENGQPNPAFSATEQGRLVREQPDVARRMAREAGWKDHKITW